MEYDNKCILKNWHFLKKGFTEVIYGRLSPNNANKFLQHNIRNETAYFMKLA